MNDAQIQREAQQIRIGICACGGDFVCTPHLALVTLCIRVRDEAADKCDELRRDAATMQAKYESLFRLDGYDNDKEAAERHGARVLAFTQAAAAIRQGEKG